MKILFFSLLSIVFIHGTYAQEGEVDNEVEKAALIKLFEIINNQSFSEPVKWSLEKINAYPATNLGGISISNGDIVGISFSRKLEGEFPVEVNDLTELRTLGLSLNTLTSELPDLGGLSKLTTLTLTQNTIPLSSFPSWLADLTKLTYLNLKGNNFNGPLPTNFGNLRNLKSLYLSNNDLSDENSIPTTLAQITTLNIIDLQSCKLNEKSFQIGWNLWTMRLSTLRLGNNPNLYVTVENGDRVFPNIFGVNPGKIETLYLYGITADKFPIEFMQLDVLKIYFGDQDFSNTDRINSLLNSIKEHNTLNSIAFYHAKLTEIPTALIEMDGLKTLNIFNNNVRLNLADDIDFWNKLNSLTSLSLSQCKLNSLPSSFNRMQSLAFLGLGLNLFETIPSEIKTLVNLVSLEMRDNDIIGIPSWLGDQGNLENLQHLYLSGNLIQNSFPDGFFQLENLKSLELSDNRLKGILDARFSNFSNLEYLYLYENEIELPLFDFSGLNELKSVHIYENRLKGVLPEQLIKNKNNLSTLYIQNNQLQDINLYDAIYSRVYVNTSYNAFTFKDLLTSEGNYSFQSYTNQALVDIEKSNQAMIGDAVTLSADVDREVTGCVYTWYQKNGDGQDIAIANTADFTITSVTEADLNKEYFYTITHPDLPSLTLTSYIQTLSEYYCPPNVDIDFFKWDYLCAVKLIPILSALPEGIRIISYNWSFGDGTTSVLKAPLHEYSSAAQYNVTLDLVYTFDGCDELTTAITKTITYDPTSSDNVEEVTLNLATQKLDQVLAINATAFSDDWALLPYSQVNDLNPYENASKGVWRTSSLHALKTERVQSTNVNLKTNGGFTADYFVPQFIDEQMIPNWLKTNTVTQYNSLGNEVENKDILGIYSAELYGYGGHLPTASGANMNYQEMAATSFEDLTDLEASNWYITDRQRAYFQRFSVPFTQGHIARLKVAENELDDITSVNVEVTGSFNFTQGNLGTDFIQDVDILCREYNAETGVLTIILSEAPNGFWVGNIQTKRIRQGLTNAIFDEGFAHTGTNSLLIQNEGSSIFKQELLKLQANKNYQFSAWVSINNTALLTPSLGEGIGVELALRNRAGDIVNTVMLAPAGPIVEGWQQINGSILVSENNLLLEVGFKKGDQAQVWFDDLRFHPLNGNLKSFVYDRATYRLKAILDENNFATFYSYDQEGNLYLVKKETTEGIKTISENNMYQINADNYNE